ncbi:MAG: GGDEF domain-containing protein [Oscillospiraceae bacterium]|nr:GGDEF domain-containing protein [Oscillospiraceae bacterium]
MTEESIKHIVVIAAGVDEEYQNSVIDGVIDCAKKANANVTCFASFGGVISNSKYDIGEYNIYNLINYRKFDGAVLLTNTICNPEMKKKIIAGVKAAGIPGVFLDCDDDPDFYNIKIDNIEAMRAIVQHVIQEHGAKTVNYISGPLSNPEAQARYEAFLHVMAENRLIADARRVYFGEFRPIDGERAVEEFLNSGMPLPDAIISANDAMALSAMRSLQKAGYSIPEDIIVTGFDNTYNARHYCPTLSSVSRPLYDAGYKACEVLLDAANGGNPEKVISLSAEPVFTESCGCKHEGDEDFETYKKSTFDIIDNCRSDIAILNRMTSELAESETPEQNQEVITKFLSHLECDQWCMCLCAEWNTTFRGSAPDDYQIHGYTKTMSAPLIWQKDGVGSVDSFSSSQMFPLPLEGGGNVSFFLPLHFRERCLGYYIITGSKFPMKSMLCHSIMMNISNSIENIRKLLHLNNVISELDKLYVIDPLCGIFNRNGFIREADLLYRKCEDTGDPLLISFIDMDGLKIVNDNYGHKEGDFALQRLASVIKDCCLPGQICARFGGDEFIILGIGTNEDEVEALEYRFLKRLSDQNHIINKPYELSASIGTYIAPIDPNVTLFNMITTADQMMYEKKKKKKTSRYLRKE